VKETHVKDILELRESRSSESRPIARGQFFGNNPIWHFDGPGFQLDHVACQGNGPYFGFCSMSAAWQCQPSFLVLGRGDCGGAFVRFAFA
jgi:hypothetical protein